MRPTTDSTNDPTKIINTKLYGRHKYLLLVRATSTYVPLYRKFEHRVMLLIGWPLSSFLRLERFLNFSLRIHRNAHSDLLSYCSCLFIRNNTNLPKKHANPSNAINVYVLFSRTVQKTHRAYFTLHSMCVKKRSIQHAHGNTRIGFASVLRTRHETPRARVNPMGENDMLMHMCV